MHIRANQTNPNAQMDALYAAGRAAAKQQAERTRKKLLESASELAGEAGTEDCVVRLSSREEEREKEAQEKEDQSQGEKKQEPDAASESTEGSISDWA